MSEHFDFENPSHPRAGEKVRLIGGPKHGWVYNWPERYFGPRREGPVGDYDVVGQQADGTWIAEWRGVRHLRPTP